VNGKDEMKSDMEVEEVRGDERRCIMFGRMKAERYQCICMVLIVMSQMK
jgi:hypothetical protein